jgi:hypothetical protein
MQKWVFHYIIVILLFLFSRIREFWPILGDIGPFLRPDLRGKLGDGFQLQIYINQGFLYPWRGHSEKDYDEYFPSQSHFYAGKLLRSTPLWAISGRSGHRISMSFILLGSRDLVEQDQISFITFWHYCDVFLNIPTEIRKPHPLRQRLGDIGEIVELHYHIGVHGLLLFMLYFRSVYVHMAVMFLL